MSSAFEVMKIEPKILRRKKILEDDKKSHREIGKHTKNAKKSHAIEELKSFWSNICSY